MTDIMTPALGESVTEATVARWAKKAGDAVKRDEVLVELETDKVSLEVSAPEDGVLAEIDAEEGATVVPGQRLGVVGAGAAGAKPAPAKAEAPPVKAPAAATAAPPPATQDAGAPQAAPVSPAVRRIAAESGLDVSKLAGAGKDGRVTKGDALAALAARAQAPAQAPGPGPAPALRPVREVRDREERVPMTRLRQTIARRLKEAQTNAAMLTTFNEVDMSAVMALRTRYKDAFEKRHGVRLGFMGFFVKACVAALKEVPAVNAEIDGTDLIYKNHYDVGVAVGTERGLVVPVLRDADALGVAQIEAGIAALGKKARDGHLALEDLQGGTFTISNGGVYGSLMSTPILNAPQSGVLGMHKIQDRPIAVGGQVVVRPMMYLALSYDHRVVDGQGAVTFLVKVKEFIEDPQRLLLEV
ncbi:MAG TPA: 2-oxoglutarate dehydrogenase complex dihydrolipoyllysine-residue succinyltransferase [Caulobacteraceae bacterium]|jgi:2-oxoglutarate dehydrogenase E2 component (dihydrolipoamide succinyltransferase)|nr:2-oxoglutarate dehydrogenase complex dihydrolipoyllysine-residue succinyltransferase [Caulobacteraceae bacterium]